MKDHLPKDQQAWVDRKLAAAFANTDAAAGERAGRDLATQLEDRWPDAAASLREGLDDMFTVRRLGINGRLAASLTNTNCIESMISIARHDPQRETVAGRQDDQTVVRGRDAQRRTQVPSAQGPQRNAARSSPRSPVTSKLSHPRAILPTSHDAMNPDRHRTSTTFGTSSVSEQTFYRWRTKYGASKEDEAQRLKALELENAAGPSGSSWTRNSRTSRVKEITGNF